MAAHTPGPWTKHQATGSFSHFAVSGGQKDRYGCRPTVACAVENEADAALIAAAPQLRAFAQKIGAIEFPEFLDAQERMDLLCDLAREARQLVAKADGAT